jgi:hypothetical protein
VSGPLKIIKMAKEFSKRLHSMKFRVPSNKAQEWYDAVTRFASKESEFINHNLTFQRFDTNDTCESEESEESQGSRASTDIVALYSTDNSKYSNLIEPEEDEEDENENEDEEDEEKILVFPPIVHSPW